MKRPVFRAMLDKLFFSLLEIENKWFVRDIYKGGSGSSLVFSICECKFSLQLQTCNQSKGSNAKYFLVAQKLMIYKGLDKSPIKNYLAGLFRESTCTSVQTVVEFHG